MAGSRLDPLHGSDKALPWPTEFLIFDREVIDHCYKDAADYAYKIVDAMPKLKERATEEHRIPHLALASWKSGVKHRSSKIEATKCILGPFDKSNIQDFIKKLLVDNPKESKEYFDKSKYTNENKEEGRQIFFS